MGARSRIRHLTRELSVTQRLDVIRTWQYIVRIWVNPSLLMVVVKYPCVDVWRGDRWSGDRGWDARWGRCRQWVIGNEISSWKSVVEALRGVVVSSVVLSGMVWFGCVGEALRVGSKNRKSVGDGPLRMCSGVPERGWSRGSVLSTIIFVRPKWKSISWMSPVSKVDTRYR